MRQSTIRPATLGDVPAVAAIYAEVVENGTASFELVAPSETEMADRFRSGSEAGYPWLIADDEGVVVGFAYAGPYRERPGYRHTVQDAIYMTPTARGRGVGRALLTALIDEAERLGFRQMIAIVGDSANRASIQLHAALGFMPIGVAHDVGRKHGRWLDTVMMQLSLGKGALDSPDDEIGSAGGDGEG